jgi:hypothetical protein
MKQLLEYFDHRSPANDESVAVSEQHLGVKLPPEYLKFLRLSNGGEGFIGKNAYIMLWSVEELASMNLAYEVSSYAPGLLIFGSDGGGEAYGFDTRRNPWMIVKIPFVGMDWELARPVGNSFLDFLARLYEEVDE